MTHCCLNTVEHRSKLLTERDVMKSIIAKVQWFANLQACCLGRHDEERDRTKMSNSGKQERSKKSGVKIIEQDAQERSSKPASFLLWTNKLP